MLHQAFEERLSVHFLIIIALYFVHHNKKLQSFDHKTKYLNINLLKHITGRYRVTTDIHMYFMLVVFFLHEFELHILQYHILGAIKAWSIKYDLEQKPIKKRKIV